MIDTGKREIVQMGRRTRVGGGLREGIGIKKEWKGNNRNKVLYKETGKGWKEREEKKKDTYRNKVPVMNSIIVYVKMYQ